MAQTEEKIFADGFSFKKRENAPDFVVGRISVKVDDAISFLKKHQKGFRQTLTNLQFQQHLLVLVRVQKNLY